MGATGMSPNIIPRHGWCRAVLRVAERDWAIFCDCLHQAYKKRIESIVSRAVQIGVLHPDAGCGTTQALIDPNTRYPADVALFLQRQDAKNARSYPRLSDIYADTPVVWRHDGVLLRLASGGGLVQFENEGVSPAGVNPLYDAFVETVFVTPWRKNSGGVIAYVDNKGAEHTVDLGYSAGRVEPMQASKIA